MKRIFSLVLILVTVVSTINLTAAPSYAADRNSGNIVENLQGQVDKAKDKAGNAAKRAAKKTREAGLDIRDKAEDAATKAGNTLNETMDSAKEKVSDSASKFKAFISEIDSSEFEKGWDKAAEYASTALATARGKEYITAVEDSITKLQNDINAHGVANAERTTASEGGFLAEQWHADTYNVNAAAAGSKSGATALESNDLGSVDVSTTWGEDYSLKYYRDGKKSAKAQARTFYEKYRQYCNDAENRGEVPMSEKEFMDQKVPNKELSALYESMYAGQKRLIPEEQIPVAENYLRKRINKEKISTADRQYLSESAQETLDNLAGRIENKEENITSEALSKEDAEAIATLARDGKFEPEDFGVTPSQVIKPRYILKQAIGAGASAAVVQAALSAGPDIYQIFVDAAKTGDIDQEQLKKLGVDALLNGSEGFVEGSVSDAILIAAQSGKLGAGMTDLSPNTVGTVTVLAIDAARYGYQLSQGEITPVEYSDCMAEDIVVAIISQASGTALQALLPMIPFAYLAGSMAGAMLASTGYTIGKQAVLDIRDSGGFATIVPEGAVETLNVGKEAVSEEKIKKQVSKVADTVAGVTKSGVIKVTQNT